MTAGNMTTIARPYANAAFECALAKDQLVSWEGMLNAAAMVVENSAVLTLLTNPKFTTKQQFDLFNSILDKVLDTEKRNFIGLLAKNKRLPVLPDIAKLFTTYRALKEKSIAVKVISAVNLDDNYRAR